MEIMTFDTGQDLSSFHDPDTAPCDVPKHIIEVFKVIPGFEAKIAIVLKKHPDFFIGTIPVKDGDLFFHDRGFDLFGVLYNNGLNCTVWDFLPKYAGGEFFSIPKEKYETVLMYNRGFSPITAKVAGSKSIWYYSGDTRVYASVNTLGYAALHLEKVNNSSTLNESSTLSRHFSFHKTKEEIKPASDNDLIISISEVDFNC